MRFRFRFALPVVALGCGTEDPGRTAVQLPCDIRGADCQREIYVRTARLRNASATQSPPVRTLTPDEVAAELRQSAPDGGVAPDPWYQAMGELALVSSESSPVDAAIDAFLSDAAAYYDPRTGGVTVVDRGVGDDPGIDDFYLSHEFVHALQDETVGLEAFKTAFVDSTDSAVAVDALVEGEATLLSLVLYAGLSGVGPLQLDYQGFGDDVLAQALESVASSTSPLLVAIDSLSYGIGTSPLAEIWKRSGTAGVAALYASPSTSVAMWVDGAAAHDLDPRREFTCYPTTAPGGFVPLDWDRLGMAGVVSLLVQGDLDPPAAWDRTQGWMDDRVVLFVDDVSAADPRVAVAWRSQWRDATTAAAFAAVAEAALPPAVTSVAVDGSDVLIRAAGETALVDGWPDGPCGVQGDLPDRSASSPVLSAMQRRLPRSGPPPP